MRIPDGSRDGSWGHSAEIITDHLFDPGDGEWYERCRVPVDGSPCGLAESAHAATNITRERP